MASRRFATLLFPIIAAALAAAALLSMDTLTRLIGLGPQARAAVIPILATLLCLFIAWFISRLVDVFIWRAVALRTGRAAPQLLVAIIRLLILLAAVAVIITTVFQYALTGLVVSSGVVGIVLGFALQRMISDFFCGIALGMEHPFRMGDWIEVDGVTGRVVETNWRATRIVTLDQVTVMLPNSFIAERRFQNYNLPEAYFRTNVTVTLEFSVPPADAKRALIAAVRATDGVLPSPEPDVLLREFGPSGNVYNARFYVADYGQMMAVRDRVNISVARHLWQAGHAVAYPKQDIFHAPMPLRELDRKTQRDALLSRVELFEPLHSDELTQLAGALVELRCRAGQEIVRQGEPGASLFIVVDGLLEVRVGGGDEQKVVGRVGPGEFFGEISLLTGSPRGATVIALTEATLFELSHEVISPILHHRPQVAEAMSRSVAVRQLRNSKAMERSDPVSQAAAQRSFTEDLLRRVRGFFRIDS